MSSPIFESFVDPQQGQFCGAAATIRSRGRCSGERLRDRPLALKGFDCDRGRRAFRGKFTGGGITAGIDFALVVAAELSGEAFAQTVQLNVEYAPAPPFDSGRPETATPEALAMSRARYARPLPGRLEGARAATARLSVA
jgi:cyclohexyl-isocyanide hydratase